MPITNNAQLVAAAKTIDNEGDLGSCMRLEERIRQAGITLHELIVEPLSADWHAPLETNHFRSGCAPIEAIERAVNLIDQGAEAVLIRGDDPIRSGYSRDERLERMAIYGTNYPLTQAYNELAECFIDKHAIDEPVFIAIRDALFHNHQRAYAELHSNQNMTADARWLAPVTPLFRGVDCANPLVDFSGRVLITSWGLAERLQIPSAQRLSIAAVATHALDGDGKEKIHEIAD